MYFILLDSSSVRKEFHRFLTIQTCDSWLLSSCVTISGLHTMTNRGLQKEYYKEKKKGGEGSGCFPWHLSTQSTVTLHNRALFPSETVCCLLHEAVKFSYTFLIQRKKRILYSNNSNENTFLQCEKYFFKAIYLTDAQHLVISQRSALQYSGYLRGFLCHF